MGKISPQASPLERGTNSRLSSRRSSAGKAVDWSKLQIAPKRRCPSMKTWATEWLTRRRDEGLRCWRDYLSMLQNYILPAFGRQRVDKITAQKARAFYSQLKTLHAQEQLAPRTVNHIWGLLETIFKDAITDGLVTAQPCILRKGERLIDRDKDPAWRRSALYYQNEVELLISEGELPFHVRCTFAILFLTGIRVGELGALKMSDLDTSAVPLWRLNVLHSFSCKNKVTTLTKTQVLREVPIHPTLQELLSQWLKSGWALRFGRMPTSADWLMPAKSNTRRGEPLQLRGDRVTKWRERALEHLRLRDRRTHDARHAFVSIARAANVNEKIFAKITHPGAAGRSAHEGYAHNIWEPLCSEMMKLPVRLLPPGYQLPLF